MNCCRCFLQQNPNCASAALRGGKGCTAASIVGVLSWLRFKGWECWTFSRIGLPIMVTGAVVSSKAKVAIPCTATGFTQQPWCPLSPSPCALQMFVIQWKRQWRGRSMCCTCNPDLIFLESTWCYQHNHMHRTYSLST